MTAFYSWRLHLHDLPRRAARRPPHHAPRARKPAGDADPALRARRGGGVRRASLQRLFRRRARRRVLAEVDLRPARAGQPRARASRPAVLGQAAAAGRRLRRHRDSRTCSTSAGRGFPARSPRASAALYLFLLNKWYFDELFDAHLRAAVPSRSASASGRAATAPSSTGSAPTGSPARTLDAARGASRLQTGYLYHYAFAI